MILIVHEDREYAEKLSQHILEKTALPTFIASDYAQAAKIMEERLIALVISSTTEVDEVFPLYHSMATAISPCLIVLHPSQTMANVANEATKTRPFLVMGQDKAFENLPNMVLEILKKALNA